MILYRSSVADFFVLVPCMGHSKTNVHFMSLLSFEAKNKTVLSFKANCLFPTFN